MLDNNTFKLISFILIISLGISSCNLKNDKKVERVNMERELYQNDDYYGEIILENIRLEKGNYATEYNETAYGWYLSGVITRNQSNFNYTNIKFELTYFDSQQNIIKTEEILYKNIIKKNLGVGSIWLDDLNVPENAKKFRIRILDAEEF